MDLKPENITEGDIINIERNIGVGHGAWDTVNKKEIIIQIYNYLVLKNEAQALINKMRDIACKVGPLHSYWDTIIDLESLLRGKEAMRGRSLEECVRDAKNYLIKGGHF